LKQNFTFNGLTPADLVFPSFLFILGMAVPLALSKNKPIGVKSIIRIIALFLIGVLINLIDEKF
jgi:predicted acyltransferase